MWGCIHHPSLIHHHFRQLYTLSSSHRSVWSIVWMRGLIRDHGDRRWLRLGVIEVPHDQQSHADTHQKAIVSYHDARLLCRPMRHGVLHSTVSSCLTEPVESLQIFRRREPQENQSQGFPLKGEPIGHIQVLGES